MVFPEGSVHAKMVGGLRKDGKVTIIDYHKNILGQGAGFRTNTPYEEVVKLLEEAMKETNDD